jgi:hypothetical protein
VTTDELRAALTQARRAAGVCGPFCRTDGEAEGGALRIGHNGTGSGDTDSQTVHAPAVLALTTDKLTDRLAAWIKDLHKRKKTDLNTTP